jgi:hypothetical protein
LSLSDRQEYGFRMVKDNGESEGGDSGPDIPLYGSNPKELERRGVHYESLLRELNKDGDEMLQMYFFGDIRDAYDECVEFYKEKNIY